ncbi:hypothetical protein J437_LFUL005845 [Ladona fulva]|uniref:Uncharacterized protein n=1 Tax=Ladona fulva TaxID=123851 RepID=A0A8K0K7A5_LADFU|nr:hypothetical protein J437_LFUL005845 [Ladona fulva]
MTHCVGLRSKLYWYKVKGEKEKKKAKGITKTVINKALHFKYRKMNVMRSMRHQLYTIEMNKVALDASDDKRYICEDGLNTLAWGHHQIPRKRTQDEAFPET